ncbi:hypothetical protein CCR75_004139 [Bremia lactucae]|uniref:Uncharacterized protein n=1 Tax=Bremia lactucae TaxID=4779 RepID=A0A976FIN9_BRELC|nr:hypothetical protein CCR75_004139 [Bremia lactucae]
MALWKDEERATVMARLKWRQANDDDSAAAQGKCASDACGAVPPEHASDNDVVVLRANKMRSLAFTRRSVRNCISSHLAVLAYTERLVFSVALGDTLVEAKRCLRSRKRR